MAKGLVTRRSGHAAALFTYMGARSKVGWVGRGHEAESSEDPEAGRLQQICQTTTRDPGLLAAMVLVQHRAPQVRSPVESTRCSLILPNRDNRPRQWVSDWHCTRLAILPGTLSLCRQRQAQSGRRGEAQLALRDAPVFPVTQLPGQTVAGETTPLQRVAQPADRLRVQQSQANPHSHRVYVSETPIVKWVQPPAAQMSRSRSR